MSWTYRNTRLTDTKHRAECDEYSNPVLLDENLNPPCVEKLNAASNDTLQNSQLLQAAGVTKIYRKAGY